MKICIVTPAPPAANPRVVKEAQALIERGYQVAVICGEHGGWASEFEKNLLPPSCEIFQVRYGPGTPIVGRVRQKMLRIISSTLLRLGLGRLGLATLAHSDIAQDLRTIAIRTPADLYIAHYVAALPAAMSASKMNDAKYAFDAEDFHMGDLPDVEKFRLERSIIRTIEEACLKGCAYVSAASPGIANAYALEYKIPIPKVVLNVFPKTQAPSRVTSRGVVEPGPSVYWFSQTIGPNRGLECIVAALSFSQAKPHLYLRGTPDRAFVERLLQIAGRSGVEERVHILPPAAPSELERLASEYDVGVVAETGSTRNRSIALTNKNFTYLIAGIPAVLSSIPAHISLSKLIPGAAIIYENGNPEDLARALDELLLSSEALKSAREKAYEYGMATFNWEFEKQKLVSLVTGAVGRPD